MGSLAKGRHFLASLFFWIIVHSGHGAIVTTVADHGSGSLRDTIAAAANGDTITFDTALSGATISITNDPIVIARNVTIDASALAQTITVQGQRSTNNCSSCDSKFRVFHISTNVTAVLSGLAISGWTRETEWPPIAGGCGIQNRGNLTVSNCVLFRNAAFAGGAILNDTNAILRIFNSTIASNASPGMGGAIFSASGSQLFISDSTIQANNADTAAGVSFAGNLLVAENCNVSRNEAVGHGAIAISTATGKVKISNCGFSENDTAYFGVAVSVMDGDVEIIGSRFENNTAFGVEMDETTIVWNRKKLSIVDCDFVQNTGADRAILSNAGALILRGSSFQSNQANRNGVGIYNSGSAIISDSTFSGNYGETPGAGIYNASSLSLTNCTFNGNWAKTGSGGGVYNSGTASVDHCTIAGNRSGWPDFGIPGSGGGIYSAPGAQTTVNNSIVADNAGSDIDGTYAGGHNVLASPKLAPLADNGGRTMTMALLDGSPAIDAAAVGGPTVDQRGFVRSSPSDIGAFELNASHVPAPTLSANLTFQGTPGSLYRILRATQLSDALSQWTELGSAIENPQSPGNFSFSDPATSFLPIRFYVVRAP